MTKLDELLAELSRRRDLLDEAQAAVNDAEEAVTQERFKDVPRHAEGDVILVKRRLFGKDRWWPARVVRVYLKYTSGHHSDLYDADPGGFWENRAVTYSVYLQQKDGTFGGSSEGYYHDETQALPEQGA